MAITRQDAINDAYERLYGFGFSIRLAPIAPDFAAHGPMGAEALSTLGQNEAVAGWVDAYKAERHHLPMPARKEPIDGKSEGAWRRALGDFARATDWLDFFRRELEEKPWQQTIREWVPTLIDGYSGGLTHGLIRTAYAVRALPKDQAPTPLELDELSRGLAYWAGVYQTVPGDPDEHGELSIEQAIEKLPRAAGKKRIAMLAVDAARSKIPFIKSEHCMAVSNAPEFGQVIESLQEVNDAEDAISRHTVLFARVLLAHPDVFPVPLIHTVTAPTAMRNLLPYLPPEFGAHAYGNLWQTSAAIVARFADAPGPEVETNPEIGESILRPADLTHRAMEHGDEHAIKFTEACLREDAIRPDPVYRVAAEAIFDRLKPMSWEAPR